MKTLAAILFLASLAVGQNVPYTCDNSNPPNCSFPGTLSAAEFQVLLPTHSSISLSLQSACPSGTQLQNFGTICFVNKVPSYALDGSGNYQSLIGPQGPAGPQGQTGMTGAQGPQGIQGPPGVPQVGQSCSFQLTSFNPANGTGALTITSCP